MEERRVNRIQLALIFGTGFPHNLSNMGVRGSHANTADHSRTVFCSFSIVESDFWRRAESSPMDDGSNDWSSPRCHILTLPCFPASVVLRYLNTAEQKCNTCSMKRNELLKSWNVHVYFQLSNKQAAWRNKQEVARGENTNSSKMAAQPLQPPSRNCMLSQCFGQQSSNTFISSQQQNRSSCQFPSLHTSRLVIAAHVGGMVSCFGFG